MNKFIFILFAVSLFSLGTTAQFTKYVIKLKDKAGNPFNVNNPAQYLSPKSIERRLKQNIPIDQSDLPLTPRYVDSIRLSGNVTVLNQSKWLNQVCIQTTDSSALAKINSFPFVQQAQPLMQPVSQQTFLRDKFDEQIGTIAAPQAMKDLNDFYNYGNAAQQIHLHEGEYLHNKGFRGEGMEIAILDAGFFHYMTLPAFDSVRVNNQIAETFDYVNNEPVVDEDHPHGMQCFSIIAGNIPGQLVGSGPKATFYLYRTEDAGSEMLVEEQNWATAAERADSIGIDVISTSLGYNQFDNPTFNHTYSDMNGNTTLIAKAADLAAKKGMIVVAAAGNEGNSTWHFITTPADADSILVVGAVNASGVPAGFSSYGPSSDGQIKPGVASIGVATALSSTTGPIVAGNGTSFATPNIAGLITCLWQAFPEFSNMAIIQAVIKSSSIYNSPDDRIGYGIPNFRKAYEDLEQQKIFRDANTLLGSRYIKVFPNPFGQHFVAVVKPPETGVGTFALYDAVGKLVSMKAASLQKDQIQIVNFDDHPSLPKGFYILKFSQGGYKQTFKLLR